MMQYSKVHSENKKNHTQARKQGTDIIEVLLEDHKPLKNLIKTMKDSDIPFKERKAIFDEFAMTLIAHAKPEEEVLYAVMKEKESLREEAFEGDVEHGIADQLVEEIKRTTDEDVCGARIKVLAELVEHHIEEEEEELLPLFKKKSTTQERATLGNEFLRLKVNYLAEGEEAMASSNPQLPLMTSEAEVQELEDEDLDDEVEIDVNKDMHH